MEGVQAKAARPPTRTQKVPTTTKRYNLARISLLLYRLWARRKARETTLPRKRYHLDVTGTFCPLPILLSAREMRKLQPGDQLEILGDDPGILEDMPVW